MTDEDAEKAFTAWDEGYGFMTGNLGRVAFMAGRESQRSRTAALEAAVGQIRAVRSRRKTWHGFSTDEEAELDAILESAPSTVLDQMIREAKAEAVEAARDAIMPPVNWNLRPDGTEMPGTQHIDGALHDIHVQLSAMAADIRSGETDQ